MKRMHRLVMAAMLLAAAPAAAATITVPDDLAGQLTQLHNDLLAIAGLLKAPSAPAAPVAALPSTLAAVEAGPGTAYPTIASALTACLPTGCTITLRDGTYAEANNIGKPNITIQAMNRRKAILDGGGGCPTQGCNPGTPGRLAWGKGVIHTDQVGTHLIGVVLTGGGGRDGKSDGEAGFYAEGATTTALLEDVQIDGNEDGIHTNGAAVTVRNSEWNVGKSNGQAKDGLSHDVYATFGTYTEVNCFHYGNDYGNLVKVRQVVTTTLTGGLYVSTEGRALDNTSGGDAILNGVTIVVPPGTVGNVLGYADENSLAGIGKFTMTGGTLIINRSPSRILMPNGGVLAASGVAQYFGTGVTLEVDGTGTAPGLTMSGPAQAQPALPVFSPTAK